MSTSVSQVYNNNIDKNILSGTKYSRRIKFVGTIRVLLFITFLIVFVYLINARELSFALLSFAIFIALFIGLVRQFNKFTKERTLHRSMLKINELELERLNNNFGRIDNGQEFIDESHSYSQDIDVFGDHSLFQLLNRTSTIKGKQLLANRLTGGELPTEPKEYHTAVKELSMMLDFTQKYEGIGKEVKSSEEDFNQFELWLSEPNILSSKRSLKILLYLLPAIFLIGLLTAYLLSITYYTLLPVLIINGILIGKYHKRTSQVVEKTSASVGLLKSYVAHLDLLAEMKFKSSFLNELKNKLENESADARKTIRQLASLLEQLQVRTNMLHIFINIPLLLDLQWLFRLSSWKSENADSIRRWIDSLAEFEVLNSMAGLAFMFPHWSFPALEQTEFEIDGLELGHPLINQQNRITNDIMLKGAGNAVIITGPNMAGKSTFLRTVATNMVLAQAGSPVCASSFVLSQNLRVFTAMRTHDNLSENVSSFYAELERIKQLLELVKEGNKVIYFLDELLKGTNSSDRHRGAQALIKQLIALGVTGFVSTHDIELGEMTQELQNVSNYSFESDIIEGRINFDYKIREGVCSSFNASELMRQMGIQV